MFHDETIATHTGVRLERIQRMDVRLQRWCARSQRQLLVGAIVGLLVVAIAPKNSLSDSGTDSARSGASLSVATEYSPTVGQPHPDFYLPTIDGRSLQTLSNYRGKKVLLIHMASWASNFRRQIPLWQRATHRLIRDGKLVVIGVAQEQHSERCQLLAQWKQLDWPILHDPMNSLGVDQVPLMVLIDEYGIVRHTKPTTSNLKRLVTAKYFAPTTTVSKLPESTTRLGWLTGYAARQDIFSAWLNLGDAQLKSLTEDGATQAISAYQRAAERIEKEDESELQAMIDFRLGTAYRTRFDSSSAERDDFENAMKHWSAAYRAKPNQSVYRRRMQQYGALDSKPHAFFDWTVTAEKEVRLSGKTPVRLRAPLSRSETMKPASRNTLTKNAREPDPRVELEQDFAESIHIRPVLVPSKANLGETVRVYLKLTPVEGRWPKPSRKSNSIEPVKVWIENASGLTVQTRLFETLESQLPSHDDSRIIEFDCKSVGAPTAGYAVYQVVDPVDGKTKWRRQSFAFTIPMLNPIRTARKDSDSLISELFGITPQR